MIEPYYKDDYVTIYNGDCLEIMPQLDMKFDLVLTDPPYGIGESMGKNKSRSNLAGAKDYGYAEWDRQINQEAVDLCRTKSDYQIIFGGNFYSLPPTSCWLIWDKENGDSDFADCEIAWTNLNKAIRLKKHRWCGMLRKFHEARFHPTQKPLDVILWAIKQAPGNIEIILDPFLGSGTTCVAAKRLNKKCIGIEIEERYCEIAAKRCSQEVLDLA